MTSKSVKQEPVFHLFLKFVSANVLGMIGFSCYILADTFFIAKGIGADALAALNLALPAYSLMNGTGLMIGMGGAARYTLSAALSENSVRRNTFTQAVFLSLGASIIFSLSGLLFSGPLAALLGADASTSSYASEYLRILLGFAPLFLGNNLLLCFVRNDGAPRLSMTGMLIGSLANILLDYFFIYTLDLGMTGAAAATATAPVISMLIMSVHFIKKKNHFRLHAALPSAGQMVRICSLGVSSLITELSSGIVILIFNFLILGISGNTGVAAYGIIANIGLVLVSVYTGIAQGIQPIVSQNASSEKEKNRNKLRTYSLTAALTLSLISYLLIFYFSYPVAELFNREHDPVLTGIAASGMRLYFISLFFTGINIVSAAFLSALDRPGKAFVISILRGFILIIPAAVLMSCLFGLAGIWLSVPVTEAIVVVISLLFLFRKF